MLEKGICTECQTVITPQAPSIPTVSSIVHNPNTTNSVTPDQVEGFLETHNNNNAFKIARDDDENSSDQYDDDEDMRQLQINDEDDDIDMMEGTDITSNLASSSRSTPPPVSFKISPKKKSNKNDNKRYKRDRNRRSKRDMKRKAHPNHYENAQKRKKIKIEKILHLNKKNKQNPISCIQLTFILSAY